MNHFHTPQFQYSTDDGQSWHDTDGRTIWEGMRLRIVKADGTTIWQGHCETTVQVCAGCEGTGKQDIFIFVEDTK